MVVAGHKYTEEQDQFLRGIRESHSIKEIVSLFNEKYSAKVTYAALSNRYTKTIKIKTYNIHRYSKDEDDFLCGNLDNYVMEDLVVKFNEKFQTNLTLCAIKSHCFNFDRGKKRMPKIGWEPPPRKVIFNIGDETFEKYIWVKVKDDPIENSIGKYRSANWKKKHFIVWEQAHGEIPEGCVLLFLDQNRKNCELSNLYCVNKKIRVIMCKNRWFSTDPVRTLTAIKYCELFYALKENKEEINEN